MPSQKSFTRKLRSLPWRTIAISAAIAAVYFITAKAGLALAIAIEQVSPIWPPTGLALAVVLLLGYRYLPAIAIGAFAANATADEPLLVAAAISIGNTLEALVGGYLIKRFTRQPLNPVERDLFIFTIAASVCSAVSATIGATSLAVGKLVGWDEYALVWTTWWAGDALGALIFGLLILNWAQPSARAFIRHRPVLAGITLALVMFATIIVFTSPRTLPIPPAGYMIFPIMIWAAFRLYQIGVVTAAVIISVIAIWATLNGLGPFAGRTHGDMALIYVQLFIAITSVTSLAVASTVAKRERAEAELERVATDLREANNRVTNILEEVLDGDGGRRH
jgi:integral membrane sensor domain MASE1